MRNLCQVTLTKRLEDSHPGARLVLPDEISILSHTNKKELKNCKNFNEIKELIISRKKKKNIEIDDAFRSGESLVSTT
jgi:hypothetical protein